MRARTSWPLVAASLLGAASACGATTAATGSTPPSTTGALTVPIKIAGAQGAPAGAQPQVMVSVGKGTAVPVVLDTGSVGLHIYAPAVDTGAGSGVTVSSRSDGIAYVDGTKQTGVVATARVTVGGITTSKPIPFGLIRHLGCVPSKPNCPTSGGIPNAVAHHRYGVLGVGLVPTRAGSPPNPLLSLGRPYSSRWSIALAGSSGKLVLGAAVPARPAAVIPLPRPGGRPPFDDRRTDVCWTVGTLKNVCEPTLFDSGDYGMQLFGGQLGQAPTAPGSTRLPPGTAVSASLPGAAAPFWSFTAGATTSKNTVNVHRSGSGSVNAAVQAFFAFRVTFDAARGTVSLTVPS